MKLQALSIVFALIIIPIMLVLTYYIQLQVDTITLQSEYDTKLLDATYDAMSAFEINTANEDMSSVSDSLRTIIEASNNVFFNTLSTGLGMSNASRSFVEPYIPSILYTLYDGYYIYAPTKSPEVLVNDEEGKRGEALTVGGEGIKTSDGGMNYQNDKSDQTLYYGDLTPTTNGDESFNNHALDYGQILYTKKDSEGKALDGVYTANPNEALMKTNYMLKSYMPYSARYKTDEIDVEITYTLDNYVTIEGNIDGVYYSKSGYLINYGENNSKMNIYLDGNTDSDKELLKLHYSERNIQNEIENGRRIIVRIGEREELKETVLDISGLNKEELTNNLTFYTNQLEDAELLSENISGNFEKLKSIAQKVDERSGTTNCFTSVNSIDGSLDESTKIKRAKQIIINENLNGIISNIQYDLDQISAAVYYAKAEIFTEWVNSALGRDVDGNYKLKEKDIQNIAGIDVTADNTGTEGSEGQSKEEIKTGIYDFSKSDRGVFDLVGGTYNAGSVEIAIDSPFYTHKLNVIRNSIQYNLNLAMTAYSINSTFKYAMPIISDAEWDKILTNPSVVAFMQGFNCGFKTYNNYAAVSSTNNEISVSINDLYFVNKNNFNDEETEYHKIDCSKLIEQNPTASEPENDPVLISFSSKEIKYDKFYNKTKSTTRYWYDHKNLACYDCINDGNYDVKDIFKIQNLTNIYEYPRYLRKAFYIAVGKERNNLYKPNAMSRQEGYEVIYDDRKTTGNLGKTNNTSSETLSKIDYIEIAFGQIPSSSDINTISLTSDIGVFDAETDSLNTNKTTTQTKILNVSDSIEGANDVPVSKDYLRGKIKLKNAYLNNNESLLHEIIGYDESKNYQLIKYIRVVYK